MNLDIPTINSRLVSSVQKREVMWNIIEPGDPYDIRKSMIAKLPGHKNFMGDHLQLVCLLQAAEIQRLCQYLDQYKLKFREVERRELDRHSYQVQIKELTLRISDEGNLKGENLKLREFLRKQSAQFEDLKKKQANSSYEAEFVRKYEESLRQVEAYMRENQLLKDTLNKLRQQYQQTLNVKNLQIDQLQRRLRQSSSQSGRNEAYYKLQIEYKKLQFENKRIRQINEAKNKEIQELQNKSKQFIHQLEEKSTQLRQYSNVSVTIKEYQNRFTLFGQQIERLNFVLREKSNQYNDLLMKYRSLDEDKRRQNEYISELQARKTQIEESYRQMQYRLMETSNTMNVLDESRSVIKNYESNMEKLSHQIERLNIVLRKKITQLDEANSKIAQYQYELRKGDGTKRQVQEFRLKFSEFNRKMAEYQNRIAISSQEIDRLSQTLKRKNDQANSYEQQLRTKASDLQSAHQQYYNLQIEYKSQISYITSNYESKIIELDRENQMNKSKLQDYSLSQSKNIQSQLDRLNLLITNKNAEIERLQSDLMNNRQRESFATAERQRITQYEIEINNYRQDNDHLRSSLDEYQERILQLSKEIERLNLMLKKSNSSSPSRQKSQEQLEINRVAQYQNKIAILSQEIERLNDTLKIKDNKIKSYEQEFQLIRRRTQDQLQVTVTQLRRKEVQAYSQIDRLKQELRIVQQNLNRKNSDNQLNSNLNKENQLKIRQLYEENNQLTRSLGQHQHQLTVLSREIERLNEVLKLKIEAADSLEQRLRNAARESDDLRKKIIDYQNKIALFAQQNERIKSSYQMNSQFEIENYKRKISDQEKRLSQLEGYIRQTESRSKSSEQQIRTYEQQTRSAYQQVETLRSSLNQSNRKYNEYENKIMLLSRQIQRLNQILQKFNNQNQDLKRKLFEAEQLWAGFAALEERLSRSAQQNQELKKKLNEGHQSKTKLNQDYQIRVRQITIEKEQQFRQFQQQQTKISYLIQQIEHANTINKDRTQEITSLQAKIRSFGQQNEALNRKLQQFNLVNRKIAQYDSKIALLSQQIERLNNILKTKVDQISIFEKKCHSYEIEITNYQRKIGDFQNNIARELQAKNTYLSKQNEELKFKLRQLSTQASRIPDIQNKFALTLGEVERLNNALRAKVEEINSQAGKIRSLEQELQRSKRRNQELENTMHRQLKNQSSVFEQRISQLSEQNEGFRKNLRELSDINRRIPQLQNNIGILSTEIQRLNEVLGKYNKEIVPSLQQRNRNFSLQNDEWRRKYSELIEVNKTNQQLGGRLKLVNQENQQNARRVQQYEARMAQVSGEIQRLNNVLRNKTQQISNLQLQIKQSQSQNEQTSRRLRQISQTARKLPQYQSKINILGQQIERLNGLLRSRGEQINAAQSKLRMFEHQFQTLQRKLNDQEGSLNEQKKYRLGLEQKLNSLNNQNQQMRRTLRQLSDSNRRLADYQSRIALLSQQVQRLNGNLRMKSDQLVASQNMLRNLRKEADAKINSISTQLQEYRRKASQSMSSQASRLAQYEGKMVILSKEIERLNIVLKETTYELEGSQNREKQCLQEIERLNNTLRLKVEETIRWQQAHGELKLKLRSFQENFNNCNSQYEKLKNQHNILTEEYKKSNQHLVEYEQSINKLYQQFERLQSIIQSLKKENYELKVRLQEAGNLVEKNRVLSAEIDRLLKLLEQQTVDLQELRLQLTDQFALQRRINEYMALMVILFAEIQSLRKRVKETEKQIESVRRSSLAPFKV